MVLSGFRSNKSHHTKLKLDRRRRGGVDSNRTLMRHGLFMCGREGVERLLMKKITGLLMSIMMVVGMLSGGMTAVIAEGGGDTPDNNTETSTYAITINAGIDHGAVIASVDGAAVTSAAKDATVTMTAYPDSGYQLDTISVSTAATEGTEGTSVDVAGEGNTRTFTMPESAVTVTAEFSEISAPASHTVTLNTNEGVIADGKNITSYTEGTELTLPTEITREGYEFGGWFGNAEFTGDAVTVISSEANTDLTFYAKWNAPALLGSLGKGLTTQDAVTYIDVNGESQNCESYTVVQNSGEAVTWTSGWYVVNENVTITGGIKTPSNTSADIHLILCDGATLTVTGGDESNSTESLISLSASVNSQTEEISPSNLTIYGQSNHSGKLVANNSGSIGIYVIGNVTVAGGTVEATGSNTGIKAQAGDITIKRGTVTSTKEEGNQNYGIYAEHDVTIEDGTVTAAASGEYANAGIRSGNDSGTGDLTISGGTVTATGTGRTEATGIHAIKEVSITGGNVTATGTNKAIDGKVKNSVAGTGWTNTEGTEGQAAIATSTDGQTLSYKKVQFPVTVTGVTLDKTTATITLGGTAALTATVSPDNAPDKTVKWSVNNSNVKLYTDEECTIEIGDDATSALTVYAKGITAGDATVTVTSNADNTKTATSNITVHSSPSDLHWGLITSGGDRLIYEAVWKAPTGSDASGVTYAVTAYWKNGSDTADKTGTAARASSEDETLYCADFADFFRIDHSYSGKGAGEYWFKVVTTFSDGKTVEVTSPHVQYHKIDLKLKTVDEQGQALEDEDSGTLSYTDSLRPGTQTGQISEDVSYIIPDATVTITADPEIGYEVQSIQEANTVANETRKKSASFEVNSNKEIIATFVKKTNTVSVTIDFCENHSNLAERVAQVITWAVSNDDINHYNCTVNGTKLIITNWPKASSKYDVRNYVDDIIDDLLESSSIDQNEYHGHSTSVSGPNIGTKQLVQYTGEEELKRDITFDYIGNTPITDNEYLYVLWSKPISEVNVKIQQPICGTEVGFDAESTPYKNGPKIESIEPEKTVTSFGTAIWVTKQNNQQYPGYLPLNGKIKGGESYLAEIGLSGKLGYYLSENTQIKFNGSNVEYDMYSGGLVGAVTAVHEWSDTWTTSTEPTIIAEGTKTRQCKHYSTCNGTETETIAKVTYSTASGDGNVWTKGSSSTSDFRFVRSFESTNATAYNKFTGIQVDGKTVPTSSYTKEQGSVIVKLKPAYLETLSVGGHTITALFETVSGTTGKASASFTIKNKSSSGGSSTPSHKDNVVTCQMAGYPANYAWNEAAKACQAGYLDAGGNFHPYNTARRSTPNTGDNGNLTMYAMAMFLMTFVAFITAKKLTEDSRA